MDQSLFNANCGESREELATMIKLKVNGKEHAVDVTPDTPLLWVLRESLSL